ncbi:MAG: Rho termination factor N-terminal domain-containing protein, partial [Chloroflexi bacterium]|nr:Rho termination factor N-terminal domain-containing protein [Chloroflexota bacterium]
MNFAELETMKREDLIGLAKDWDVPGYSTLKKNELVLSLLQAQAEKEGNTIATGMLEVTPEGYGFLRRDSLLPSSNDIYVSQSQIRRFSLRTGDTVMGQARPSKEGERYQSLLRVELVNDLDPEAAKDRTAFEHLTPIFPDQLFDLECNAENLSTRVINLVAPIGRGQRGLIVSPPKAGKTILLKRIASAI